MIICISERSATRQTLVELLDRSRCGSEPAVLAQTPQNGYFYVHIASDIAARTFRSGLSQLGIEYDVVDSLLGGIRATPAKVVTVPMDLVGTLFPGFSRSRGGFVFPQS